MRIAAGLPTAALLAALLTAPAALADSPAAPAAATAAKAPAFSADTPIEVIQADPAAKAALEQTVPDLAKHPSYDMFKGMSLRELQPYSGGKITNEHIAKVDADLKALPAKP